MSGILDTIDGAIEDWETSDDAMRWMPPDEHPNAEARALKRQAARARLLANWHAVDESLPVETVRMVGPYRVTTVTEGNTMRLRVEFDAHLYADAMARVRDAMEHLARTINGLTYTIDEARPENPRERALRLARERGHGPQVPLDRRRRSI